MAKIENTLECVQALMKSMFDNGAKSLKIKDKDFEISIELDCGTAPVYVNGGVPSYLLHLRLCQLLKAHLKNKRHKCHRAIL